MNTNFDAKKKAELIGTFIGKIIVVFLHSAFILWGWNVIAPRLNAPLFTYWEIFAMRLAFGSIIKMFRRNENKG